MPRLTLEDLRDGRAFISVEEFASLPGSPSRGVCYEGVRQGVIPSVSLGRRRLIPVLALLTMLSDPQGLPADEEGAEVVPFPTAGGLTNRGRGRSRAVLE